MFDFIIQFNVCTFSVFHTFYEENNLRKKRYLKRYKSEEEVRRRVRLILTLYYSIYIDLKNNSFNVKSIFIIY